MTNRKPPGIETYRPGSEHGGPPRGPRAPGQPGPRRRRPGGPRRKPKRQRTSGLGSIILYFAVGILALIGAGLAVLFVAPPTGYIKDQLVAQVKSATGRDLKIAGRAGLTFYPRLGVLLSDVSLSPPPGMKGPAFAQMKSLNVQVKLLPLLSRQISVRRFVLRQPVFDFRVDEKGRKSWDFAAIADRGPVRFAQATGGTANDAGAPSPSSGGSFDVAALDQLELGDVRIINGKIRYTDKTAAAREKVDDINVTLALKSLGTPLTATGDLRYKGDKIDFQAVVKSLKKVLSKQPANVEAVVKSDRFDAKYNGSVDVSGDLALNGDVSIETQSIRHLATWLGTKLPPATGFGPLSIAGQLKANGPVYQLAKLKLAVDGATGSGNIKANTAGSRPKVSGNLSLSELDLNKYLPPSGAGEQKPRAGKKGKRKAKRARRAAGAGNAGEKRNPGSIEDLMNEPGPRVKGYSKRQGWSTEPIDVAALGLLDANLNLALGKLLYEKIKVGRSRMVVALADKALTAKLDEMQLYEGVGRGVFAVNAQQEVPSVSANFNLSGVSAQPLLTDAAEIDWLAGKGQLLFALKSAGIHQQAIVSQLNGTTKFAFENGAIVGVNVPKTIRSVQQGRFDNLSGSPDEQTDFSKLTGSFNIQNGIAVNKDLEMLSPLLRVTGQGRIMLPKRRVDYTVKPKLVSNLSGQGGERGATGLEIPVRVHGTFEKLSYTPDLKGVLTDPSAIKNLGRQYGGEKAGKVLDDLLGGDGGEGGGKAKELLDGLLGGR